MRLRCFMILILLAGFTLAADEKQPASGPLKLPADAVKVDTLTWRFTDAEGTIWTYRQTPFGLVRFEAEEETDTADETAAAASLIKAFDQGDEVRFERMSPFGLHRWTKKKTELTDVEREAWEQAQNAAEATAKTEPADSGPQE